MSKVVLDAEIARWRAAWLARRGWGGRPFRVTLEGIQPMGRPEAQITHSA